MSVLNSSQNKYLKGANSWVKLSVQAKTVLIFSHLKLSGPLPGPIRILHLAVQVWLKCLEACSCIVCQSFRSANSPSPIISSASFTGQRSRTEHFCRSIIISLKSGFCMSSLNRATNPCMYGKLPHFSCYSSLQKAWRTCFNTEEVLNVMYSNQNFLTSNQHLDTTVA